MPSSLTCANRPSAQCRSKNSTVLGGLPPPEPPGAPRDPWKGLGEKGKKLEAGAWFGRHPPCWRFFPRQQEYVDYVMREFQGQEKMMRGQYRLRFHLPMRIIPL